MSKEERIQKSWDLEVEERGKVKGNFSLESHTSGRQGPQVSNEESGDLKETSSERQIPQIILHSFGW